ncbi:MAG TPA: pilin, partial [Candidatus Baltobacteraceae bacterium]|nr:pilin [Candidatus Baltobacteraceae bacterium]
MTNSWKLRASSLLFLAAAASAAFFGFPRGAEAAGCPTTPVAENGGTHWCYEHSSDKGHVHLWKPDGYDATSAVTVIYIHGFNNDEITDKVRRQDGSYIDRAWDSHHLSAQFKASGINALFIAPEGPIGSKTTNSTAQGITNTRYTSVLWGSLNALLTSVTDKGHIVPPNDVTVAGHSAGMYTAQQLWSNSRVKHLISLDWVDGSLESSVSSWYNQGGGRMLTLVGGSSGQQTIMDRMQNALPCTRASSPLSLTAAEIAARCLYMRTSLGHMQVVTGQKAMPQALKRSSSVAAAGGSAPTAPAPSGGSSGTITSKPLEDAAIDAPLLEIPIPGLELSKAIRENGVITIPWLAQYAGGVYTFLLSIIGMVAAVMMVVGGFQYLTSGGDKGRLAAGRKRIVDALTGLVLGLSSYVILYAINPNLVSFEGLKIGAVATEHFEPTAEQAHDEGDVYPESATTVSGPGPAAGG